MAKSLNEKIKRLKEASELIYPLVKLNSINSINGLIYLIKSIKEAGRKALLMTLNESDLKFYENKAFKYKSEWESANKINNSISKVVFLQIIAEDSEKDISRILSSVYNIKARNKLGRFIYTSCPTADSNYHVFDLFRQAMIDGPSDKLMVNTKDILVKLGVSILYYDQIEIPCEKNSKE